jgi:hypothetical protein
MEKDEIIVMAVSAVALWLVLTATKAGPKLQQAVSKVTGVGGAGSSVFGGSVQGNSDYYYDL